MNKLFPVFFCATFLFLISCAEPTGTEVVLINNTLDDVIIKKIEFPQNIEIKSAKTASVRIKSSSEAFALEVLWKGETYVGDTGYIQDNRKITIELLENMNCKISANGGTQDRQLIKHE